MAEINPWVQFIGTVLVGLGSGYIGARANERAANRRYRQERVDAMLPAVREWAILLRWEGERAAGMRMGDGPPEDRMDEARAEFNRYRHDLPLDLQRQLDSDDYDNPVDYGESLQESASQLQGWIDATVGAREGWRRRLRRAGDSTAD